MRRNAPWHLPRFSLPFPSIPFDSANYNQLRWRQMPGKTRISPVTRHRSLETFHRFHSYCARFPSELVEAGIAQYTRIGDSIFDPFCGSGTTIVASLIHKRKVIGTEIDILAGMLSELKCSPLTAEQYVRWRAPFIKRIKNTFEEIRHSWRRGIRLEPGTTWTISSGELRIPRFPELNFWFPPQLTAALAGIAETTHRCRNPHYERLALISLSASIISKWPNTLSYAKDIDRGFGYLPD